MDNDDVAQVTILMDLKKMPPDLMDILEHAICPDAGEPGHEETCPLLTMSIRPLSDMICSHCLGTMRGCASLNDDMLCHPDDGLDCYRLVTIYKHAMPCETCRPVREAADDVREQLGKSFTCPQCGRSSRHPSDLQEGYCGNCHQFTGEPQ